MQVKVLVREDAPLLQKQSRGPVLKTFLQVIEFSHYSQLLYIRRDIYVQYTAVAIALS